MDPAISYSTLSLDAMWRLYKARCVALGERPMKKPTDRCRMATALALVMTRKPPQARPKTTRAIIIEELCRVAEIKFANGKAQTHGFTYDEVLVAVKRRLPKSRITNASLRVHATYIREGREGYRGAKLPNCRPYSHKGNPTHE